VGACSKAANEAPNLIRKQQMINSGDGSYIWPLAETERAQVEFHFYPHITVSAWPAGGGHWEPTCEEETGA